MLNADLLVHHLHHWGEAVGRARGCGDQVVHRRIVEIVVAAHHDIQRAVLHRGCHHHLAQALVKVRLQRLWGAELATALDHHVDPHRNPIDRAGIGPFAERDSLALQLEAPIIRDDATIPAAMHGVEFQQVRRQFRAARDLVHMDDLDVLAIPPGAEAEAPHATESIDTNS